MNMEMLLVKVHPVKSDDEVLRDFLTLIKKRITYGSTKC